jgi:hypothetical protein
MSAHRYALVVTVLSLALVVNVVGRESASAQAPVDGTSVEFHGWSPDSQYVAYTRTRRTVARRGRRKARLTRRSHHRRVKGGRFSGTGPIGPKEHVPRYAERRGYITPELDRLEVSDTETWYVALEGTYKLRLSVGDVLTWELVFEDQVIERREFDTIYVSCDARIYPSPDRRHVIVVMHLNRGWNIDGAVYPVTLPAAVAEAWAATQAR